MTTTQVLISSTAALLLSGVLMPLIIFISHRRGWYDDKDHRKIHDGDIPRLGGIGIFLGWIGGALLIPALLNYTNGEPIPISAYRLAIFILGAAAVHLTGLWDDFASLRPRNKFIIQIVAAAVTALGGIRFYGLAVPFSDAAVNFAPLSLLITMVWIVGVSNAVNLIDGLDGLSSTVSLIAAAAMGLLAVLFGKPVTALLCFSLAGAIVGFFLFNKPPARIFMGDSGSLFLGYVLATLPLLETSKETPLALGVSVTLLLIPVADTLFAMTRRLVRKQPISNPDREHLHHMLLDFGFSNWAILGIVGVYSLALGGIAMILLKTQFRFLLPVMILLWGITFYLIYFIHKLWRIKIKTPTGM